MNPRASRGACAARALIADNKWAAAIEELKLAVDLGVTVVADNWLDLEQLALLEPDQPVRLMLRFTPGIDKLVGGLMGTLAGVVVGNNIVLIQTYNYLRERYEPIDAIIRTGAMRLRPVLLTAGVTVLGLLPTMYGINVDILNRHVEIGAPGTALWTQLSLAIVAGLSFATILTLVVTPGLLAVGANVTAWRARRRERRTEGDNRLGPHTVVPKGTQTYPDAEAAE